MYGGKNSARSKARILIASTQCCSPPSNGRHAGDPRNQRAVALSPCDPAQGIILRCSNDLFLDNALQEVVKPLHSPSLLFRDLALSTFYRVRTMMLANRRLYVGNHRCSARRALAPRIPGLSRLVRAHPHPTGCGINYAGNALLPWADKRRVAQVAKIAGQCRTLNPARARFDLVLSHAVAILD